MSLVRRSLFLAASVLLLIAAGSFAFYEHQRVRELRIGLARLAEERTRLEKRIHTRAVASSVATAPKSLVASAPAPASAEAHAPLRRAAAAAEIRSEFGPLFQRLRLSLEKRAALTEAILDHKRRYAESVGKIDRLSPAERTASAHPTVLAVKADLAAENARYLAELTSLLGPDGYREFDLFQRTSAHWEQVSSLAENLYATDTPLTSVQADRLAQLLIANATSPTGRIQRIVPDWPAFIAQTATILSPPQRDALNALHDQRELWRAVNRLKANATPAAQN